MIVLDVNESSVRGTEVNPIVSNKKREQGRGRNNGDRREPAFYVEDQGKDRRRNKRNRDKEKDARRNKDW